MDIILKEKFLKLWYQYFGAAELPIVFYYDIDTHQASYVTKAKGRSCMICELAKVRKGESFAYNNESLACGGAKRSIGYAETVRPNFGRFLSCGIPGELD